MTQALRRCCCFLLGLIALLFISCPVFAQKDKPQRPIHMARGNWDTGWFQSEIYRQLLGELGYQVQEPVTLYSPDFYRKLAEGELDFWANGWIPSHSVFIEEHQEHITSVGEEVGQGVHQGFLIDKKSADQLNIKTLADFKKPEIARHFDHNGDGKADLFGCVAKTSCGKDIEHQLKAFGLTDTVYQVPLGFSFLTSRVLKLFHLGKPFLFYTWVPHFMPGLLVPGQDVYWLPVPYTDLPERTDVKVTHQLEDIPGCLINPCNTGFLIDQIRVVANKQFLKNYPDIKRLFELVKIPAQDITEQNAKLYAHEDELSDIRRQAKAWIGGHRELIDDWLKAARALQATIRKPVKQELSQEIDTPFSPEKLKVLTKRFVPFIFYQNGDYSGFSIDLWKLIANKLKLEYEFSGVNSTAKLIDQVSRDAVDIGLSGLEITSERVSSLNFSQPFFDSGLQILVATNRSRSRQALLTYALSIILSPGLLFAFLSFGASVLVAAHIIWFLERKQNPQFPESYFSGVLEGIWWSIVTITTVGYGDKTPARIVGKLFAAFWMLTGIFIFAYFTASITTHLALYRMADIIQGPESLHNKKVVTIRYSSAEAFLNQSGIQTKTVREIETAYLLLESGQVDAVVYHAPVLQYYAATEGKGRVKVVGQVFQKKHLGLLFPSNSEYIEPINQALLQLQEEGELKQLTLKWFKQND